jgi:PadR family transcriptional regulator PadR
MEMLANWESVYKRGLLTFWILLLLHDHPSFPYEINNEIEELSRGTISADGNSIYRALRRFEEMELVTSEIHTSKSGPDRRYYKLTEKGKILLAHFIHRNLLVFQDQSITDQLHNILKEAGIE